MKEFVGKASTDETVRIAIVASRFNESIVQGLLEGARVALRRSGVSESNIETAWVPGAFELPLICKKLAQTGLYDAVIAIGCVIQGETPHFDFVAGEAGSGVGRASYETGVPCIFGVITTNTLEQAIARSGGPAGNRGADAANAAIEMVNLIKLLPSSEKSAPRLMRDSRL